LSDTWTWTAGTGSVWSFADSRTYSDGQVRIRRFSPDDVLSLFTAAREFILESAGCAGWCDADYSIWDSAAFIRKCEAEWAGGRSYTFAILRERPRAFLGSVWLRRVTGFRKSAEAGIWVRSRYVGQELAAAAMRLITRFGFEELALNRLEWVGSGY
jgi:RimJ/RimL family protein N-acetyltransferase